MSKFISGNIDLINSKLSNLFGADDDKCTMKAEVRILTSTIIAVREWADDEDDEINPKMCGIYLTSGEFFILYKPYADVIEILEWY
jgi:hypothetical protein